MDIIEELVHALQKEGHAVVDVDMGRRPTALTEITKILGKLDTDPGFLDSTRFVADKWVDAIEFKGITREAVAEFDPERLRLIARSSLAVNELGFAAVAYAILDLLAQPVETVEDI